MLVQAKIDYSEICISNPHCDQFVECRGDGCNLVGLVVVGLLVHWLVNCSLAELLCILTQCELHLHSVSCPMLESFNSEFFLCSVVVQSYLDGKFVD